MQEIQIILTIIGSFMVVFGLVSLIYQFFSSSTLTIIGVICLNIAWSWFHWNWMLLFAFLWLIAISSGFLITANSAKDSLGKNTWMPVIGAVLGAIFIPIPFLGALFGVFAGAMVGLFTNKLHSLEDKNNKRPTQNNLGILKNKIDLALEITFKSFLGIVVEASAVVSMVIVLLLLALF